MAQLANRRLAMTLFSGDTCPYCHRVRIVLAEKGINYELHDVNLKDTPDDKIAIISVLLDIFEVNRITEMNRASGMNVLP